MANSEKVQLNAGTLNLTFGGNAVRFTGLLLWWLPNLENSTACFKSMPFFGDESFFGLFLVFSFDWWLLWHACLCVLWGFAGDWVFCRIVFGCACVCWCGCACFVFSMESLILAQDERWRCA